MTHRQPPTAWAPVRLVVASSSASIPHGAPVILGIAKAGRVVVNAGSRGQCQLLANAPKSFEVTESSAVGWRHSSPVTVKTGLSHDFYYLFSQPLIMHAWIEAFCKYR